MEEEGIVSFGEIVRKELAAARNDTGLARKRMRQEVRKNPGAFAAFMFEAFDALIDLELGRLKNRNRRESVGVEPPVPVGEYERIRRGAIRNVRHFMNFRLSSGPLRDATRPEIAKTASRLLKHGDTATHRGKWLRLIEHALPDDVTKVRNVLDEGKLEALWKKDEAQARPGRRLSPLLRRIQGAHPERAAGTQADSRRENEQAVHRQDFPERFMEKLDGPEIGCRQAFPGLPVRRKCGPDMLCPKRPTKACPHEMSGAA